MMRMGSPSKDIEDIVLGLKHNNRFSVNRDFDKLLDFICDQYITTLDKDSTPPLYRARIYFGNDRFEKYHNPEKFKNIPFFGFDKENSFVNTGVNTHFSNVSGGRANLQGIPCLYAAFDKDTALKEVKPYANTAVSIAEIALLEDLQIVDLCKNHGLAEDPWGAEFSMMLCSRFSEPVYDENGYLLSQHISKYMKNRNCDGIAFLSAYTKYSSYVTSNKGKNIAIFNYEKCEPINSNLYLVQNVDVEFKPFNTV